MKWTGERLVTSLDSDYFIFEHLHRYAIAKKMSAGKIILDIASGEGYGSYLISKEASYVYGIDIDESSILHAKNKYENNCTNLTYIVGSTNKIPLNANTIDIVVSFETIEHHDEHIQMMIEIKRVLKPNGILLISSPNKPVYKTIVPHNPFHVKELTLEEFEILIKKNFKYASFFEQRFVAGSLISPIQSCLSTFSTFDGDYEKITDNLPEEFYYNKAYYYLALCSDKDIKEVDVLSFFNGVKAVINQNKHSYNQGRREIMSSTSFKVGIRLTSIFSFFRNKKRKK